MIIQTHVFLCVVVRACAQKTNKLSLTHMCSNSYWPTPTGMLKRGGLSTMATHLATPTLMHASSMMCANKKRPKCCRHRNLNRNLIKILTPCEHRKLQQEVHWIL